MSNWLNSLPIRHHQKSADAFSVSSALFALHRGATTFGTCSPACRRSRATCARTYTAGRREFDLLGDCVGLPDLGAHPYTEVRIVTESFACQVREQSPKTLFALQG